MTDRFDIAIVGAGAAGLATAIFTRELNPDLSVALIDGARKPGAKILVSGGGRRNVTNRVVSERDFWGGSPPIVRRVLRGLSVDDTIAFFARLGVALHEEAGGKLFPDSNRARDVLDALLREASRVGVHCLFDYRVENIARAPEGFTVAGSGFRLRQGYGGQVSRISRDITASRVVLATGGQSLPKSGSDGSGFAIVRRLGHTIVPPVPALVPLLLERDEPLHARLSGVAHEAELTVWIDGRVATRLTGALLWTHFGLSGPLALNASRHYTRASAEGRAVALTLSVWPPARFEEMDRELLALITERPRAKLVTVLGERLPAALAEQVAAAEGFETGLTGAQLSRDARRRLARALVERPLKVIGTRGYNYAEVTAGGVDLNEIDPASLESRVCRGLYLVGEILDVDGRIGGFNFQWAWSSARVAARALAGRRNSEG